MTEPRRGNHRRNEQNDRSARGARAARGGPANRRPRIEISGARLVAYDVLRDVTERDAYANLALPSRIRAARLDARDAALATELVSGALRGMGRYDRIIELAADRDVSQIDSRTLNVLRLGVHQLLSMRTAAHAAVNESVELQRKVSNQSGAGFVNGVLRTVDRSSTAEWDDFIDAAAKSTDDSLAERSSHPAWVLRAFRDALRAEGRESELLELLDADNVPPKVSLAILPSSGVSPEEASESQPELSVVGPSPIGAEVDGGDPARIIHELGLSDGSVRVQDQGSQIAALVLSRAKPIATGETWLDLCAGPGGKTAVLGAEAVSGGAIVRANEVSEHRADLVRESTYAVDDVVHIVSYDGRDQEAYGGSEQGFDRILVDAPCSGLGALRRRPEARWRKKPSDLPELTKLQTELLSEAAHHLAPGGVLAYVTCSPHLAETRVVLDRLLRDRTDLREIDAKSVVEQVSRGTIDLAGESLSAQLWPHRHGTDAMFISLVERTA